MSSKRSGNSIKWHDVSDHPRLRQVYGPMTTRISDGVTRMFLHPGQRFDASEQADAVWNLAWMSKMNGTFIKKTEPPVEQFIKKFELHLAPPGVDAEKVRTLYMLATSVAGMMFVTEDEAKDATTLMWTSPDGEYSPPPPQFL